MAIFNDRTEAGRQLAGRVAQSGLADPVVLALPRGGVPVALEVARRLKAPLDLVLVRKIGMPGQPEFALGAVVDGDRPEVVINEEIARQAGIGGDYIDAEVAKKLVEIERRRKIYIGDRPRAEIAGQTAILVDDGIATGASVRAALQALRRRDPAMLVLAVPVAPSDTLAQLRSGFDEVICLHEPQPFLAVGLHYREFHQVDDDEVVAMLAEAESFS